MAKGKSIASYRSTLGKSRAKIARADEKLKLQNPIGLAERVSETAFSHTASSANRHCSRLADDKTIVGGNVVLKQTHQATTISNIVDRGCVSYADARARVIGEQLSGMQPEIAVITLSRTTSAHGSGTSMRLASLASKRTQPAKQKTTQLG